MMHLLTRSILVPASVIALVFASACSEDPKKNNGDDDDDSSGGTAGTGGTGSLPTMCGPTDVECPIVPSTTGWVDMTENTIGVQGSWYPYGDQYGAAKCTSVGLHDPADCSNITSPPPPPAMGFENVGGKMCTTGEVAWIQACKAGVTTEGCPDKDYSNLWGAGIGFDLNANKGAPEGDGLKKVWDPTAYNITGFTFEIDVIPTPKLRVEIPIMLTEDEKNNAMPPVTAGNTTDDHPKGAPYWGATSSYPASPVIVGKNTVRWTDIKYPVSVPGTNYVAFDVKRILGIQFHVPAVGTAPKAPYNFCISNLTFIRN
jgi:hypothetical protein